MEVIPKIPPKPPRLVTHANCMDGSTSALVFLTVYPGAKVEFVGPADVDLVGDRDVYDTYFVDVCPSVCLGHEAVIDHHASSFDKLTDRRDGACVLLDKGACGCMGLYKFFEAMLTVNDDIDTLEKLRRLRITCELVDDYDRYQLNRPCSMHLARVHQFVGTDRYIRTLLEVVPAANYLGTINDFGVLPTRWWELTKTLEESEARYVSDMVASSWIVPIVYNGEDVYVGCVVAEDYTNSLSDAMFKKYGPLSKHPISFALILNLRNRKVSIRSNDDKYDCVYIAKILNPVGGGHTRAAGLPMTDEMTLNIQSVIGYSV